MVFPSRSRFKITLFGSDRKVEKKGSWGAYKNCLHPALRMVQDKVYFSALFFSWNQGAKEIVYFSIS
jgi:hypothetical protein